MKFSIGDKVRVVGKPSMTLNGTKAMDEYAGQIVTISENFDNGIYRIKEDKGDWYWDDKLLEPIDKTDVCDGCAYEDRNCSEEPCKLCTHNHEQPNNYPDYWTNANMKPVFDNVNHPAHYCQEGSMECIDEMVAVFGVDAVREFCICNVWKYRKRALYKNKEEDLKKSDWYMKKYIELGGEVCD